MNKYHKTNKEMLTEVATFGVRTISRKLRGEEVVASDEVQKKRMETCKTCASLLNNGRCAECGCFMLLKSKFKHADCPLGKWNE